MHYNCRICPWYIIIAVSALLIAKKQTNSRPITYCFIPEPKIRPFIPRVTPLCKFFQRRSTIRLMHERSVVVKPNSPRNVGIINFNSKVKFNYNMRSSVIPIAVTIRVSLSSPSSLSSLLKKRSSYLSLSCYFYLLVIKYFCKPFVRIRWLNSHA